MKIPRQRWEVVPLPVSTFAKLNLELTTHGLVVSRDNGRKGEIPQLFVCIQLGLTASLAKSSLLPHNLDGSNMYPLVMTNIAMKNHYV